MKQADPEWAELPREGTWRNSLRELQFSEKRQPVC